MENPEIKTAQPSEKLPAKPFVSGFKVVGRRQKNAEEISKRLSELAFLEISIEMDVLSALHVESRDMQKNPYLFSIVSFSPTAVEAVYTGLPNTSPKKRRLDVLRHFLNILTLVEDCYEIEMKAVYQLFEGAISDMSEYVSSDYERLFSSYDHVKTELSSAAKKIKKLEEAIATLSKENYELKAKNDELVIKIGQLETFSDSVLSLKIQEWISEHQGEIDIAEFSKVYNVPEMRVEQMLNKLVTEGYIELKG